MSRWLAIVVGLAAFVAGIGEVAADPRFRKDLVRGGAVWRCEPDGLCDRRGDYCGSACITVTHAFAFTEGERIGVYPTREVCERVRHETEADDASRCTRVGPGKTPRPRVERGRNFWCATFDAAAGEVQQSVCTRSRGVCDPDSSESLLGDRTIACQRQAVGWVAPDGDGDEDPVMASRAACEAFRASIVGHYPCVSVR